MFTTCWSGTWYVSLVSNLDRAPAASFRAICVRISAELFTRQPDGWLLTSASRLEDSCDLQSVGCRLTLADLYERVDLLPA
jgi:hypothetical protein